MPKDRLKIATGLIERAAFMAASLKELEAAINEKGYTDEYQNGVDMAPEDSGLDPEAAAILNHIAKRK